MSQQSVKVVVEKFQLIVGKLVPVLAVVYSRTVDEVVLHSGLFQRFMKLLVDFKEEVVDSA